ncbi:hypothetical protein Hte_012569 [Hypoxylon texense]
MDEHVLSEDALASGDELRRVAKNCLDSEHRFSFVVGPPRCGKSIWVPYHLAKEGKGPVISVQPDGDVAKQHAEYLRDQCQGTMTVGVCDDRSEIPDGFEVKDEVTYMSSTWLYRLVLAARDRKKPRVGAPKPENQVRAVVLDEIHTQKIYHELGYVGVQGAVSGILKLPAGWSGDTKIVLTTAYPQSDNFHFRFRLSPEEIEQMTLRISVEEPGGKVKEVFLDEGIPWKRQAEYHRNAAAIAQKILRGNNKANILVILSKDNAVGSGVFSEKTFGKDTPIFDLSEVDVREVNKRRRGGCVIVTEAGFASRIPVDGITHVICHRAFVGPRYEEEICKHVENALLIKPWEFDFLQSYLDPAQAVGYIHYAFPRPADGEEPDWTRVGPQFTDTDCVEYMLGIVRLVGFAESLQADTPVRQIPRLEMINRAMQQLRNGRSILYRQVDANLNRKLVLAADPRCLVMFGLMDRAGLDLRAARFLGELVQNLEIDEVSPEDRPAVLLVGILVSVFDSAPVLRKEDPNKPAPLGDLVPEEVSVFPGGFRSDAWNNAVFWMGNVAAFEARGYEALKWTSDHNWRVERKPFAAAERKIRLLVEHFRMEPSWMVKLKDRSFLAQVIKLVHTKHGPLQSLDTTPFFSYLSSYMYNLVYIDQDCISGFPETVRVRDISSTKELRVDTTLLTIDLPKVLEEVDKKANDINGFYACTSRYMLTPKGILLEGLTIVPQTSVWTLMEMVGRKGWNLEMMLRLKLRGISAQE